MSTRPRRSAPAIAGPPKRKRQGPGGFLVSAFLHATIVLLLITSPFSHGFTGTHAEGAGGPGPMGGGGGRSGRGADGDRLRFIEMRPASAPAAAPVPAPALVPAPPVTPPPTAAERTSRPSVPSGVASGTGTETGGAAGSGGAGPGSGGGTGSGTGPGTGSGTGPGTGGGAGLTHPPAPVQVFLPPLPAPERIKPYHLVAWFDVDERGRARLIGFNPSSDASYNRRLRSVLTSLRFRPGVGPDGRPVRDTIDIQFVF